MGPSSGTRAFDAISAPPRFLFTWRPRVDAIARMDLEEVQPFRAARENFADTFK
jgi:hypothetical protein